MLYNDHTEIQESARAWPGLQGTLSLMWVGVGVGRGRGRGGRTETKKIISLIQESEDTQEGSPLCLRGPGNIAVGVPMSQVLEEKTAV